MMRTTIELFQYQVDAGDAAVSGSLPFPFGRIVWQRDRLQDFFVNMPHIEENASPTNDLNITMTITDLEK